MSFQITDAANAFELSVAETMMENNLQLKEVSSDGNCFFASLVICLAALPQGGQKTSMTGLRNRFANYLVEHVDELAPFFSAEENQEAEYLAAVKKIRQSRFWNNQIIDLVVGCATEVLKMNVSVFDIDDEGAIIEYEHLYEPDISEETSGRRSSSGAAEPEPEGEAKVWPTIRLLRQDDNHFNAFIAAEDA
jgi:hypothetical protein